MDPADRAPAADRTLPQSLRFLGSASGTPILCLAGFGDDGTMYERLGETRLAKGARLCLLDLPGCGAEPPSPETPGALTSLASFVSSTTAHIGASVVVAHSAAAIVAGLAAQNPASGITTLISLEGNLTDADAYFSGQAAHYEAPSSFMTAFIERLDELSQDPLIARYRDRVARADPHTLWSLGRDVAAFSAGATPGDLLFGVPRAAYVYNPDNCAKQSLDWLAASGLRSIELPGASHWPTLDAPGLVAEAISSILQE